MNNASKSEQDIALSIRRTSSLRCQTQHPASDSFHPQPKSYRETISVSGFGTQPDRNSESHLANRVVLCITGICPVQQLIRMLPLWKIPRGKPFFVRLGKAALEMDLRDGNTSIISTRISTRKCCPLSRRSRNGCPAGSNKLGNMYQTEAGSRIHKLPVFLKITETRH